MPSNLRIVDYAVGMCGSAHDATAFLHTAAARFPDWLFKDAEFCWADSAYPLSARVIPVHKQPASNDPRNAKFDGAVAHLRVRSEHTMGALKGRWQCLRGLRVAINSPRDHVLACRWITTAIILHNICIEAEGEGWAQHYVREHDMTEELPDLQRPNEDIDPEAGFTEDDILDAVRQNDGERRRNYLIDEYLEYRASIREAQE